jgi:nitrogen fixation protein
MELYLCKKWEDFTKVISVEPSDLWGERVAGKNDWIHSCETPFS